MAVLVVLLLLVGLGKIEGDCKRRRMEMGFCKENRVDRGTGRVVMVPGGGWVINHNRDLSLIHI